MAKEQIQRNLHICTLIEHSQMSYSEIANEYSISVTRTRQIYEKEIWRRKDRAEIFHSLPMRVRNGLSRLGIKTKEELKSFLESDEAFISLDKVGLGMRSIKKLFQFDNKLDKQIKS